MSFLCMCFRHSLLHLSRLFYLIFVMYFLGGRVHFLCVNGSHNVSIVIALEVSLLAGIADFWGKAGVCNKWCWTTKSNREGKRESLVESQKDN